MATTSAPDDGSATMAVKPRDVEEPIAPGTSALLRGGGPLARYLTAYGIAGIVLFATYGGLLSIILPLQVQIIVGTRLIQGYFPGFDMSTVAPAVQAQMTSATASSIGVVTSISSLFTLFAQPIIGAVSDRFRNRFGRRSVWIVTGAVFGALLMIGLELSATVAAVAVSWVLVQVTLNIMQAPLTTTVADRIPTDRRGVVSAIAGLGMMIGATGGVLAAGTLVESMGLKAYYVFGVAVVVGAVFFVVMAPDRSSKDLVVAPFSQRAFWAGFLTPIRDHDYRWAWLARLAIMLGYQGIGTFNLYLLQFYISEPMTAAAATKVVPILSILGLPGMLISMMVSGRLSDKLGRRKPFVLWASIGVALCLAVPLLAPTLTSMYIYSVLVGFAFGSYMAVDTALFIDVLPDPSAAGRDLGVANIATNLGQAGSPAAIGLLAGAFGYTSAWVWGIVWAVVAGIAILPIRRIR